MARIRLERRKINLFNDRSPVLFSLLVGCTASDDNLFFPLFSLVARRTLVGLLMENLIYSLLTNLFIDFFALIYVE